MIKIKQIFLALVMLSLTSLCYSQSDLPRVKDLDNQIIEHILHTSDQLGGVIGTILDIDSSEADQLSLKFEKINLIICHSDTCS